MVNNKTKHSQNKKNGWTLAELIIVISVIGILGIGIPQILLRVWQFYKMHVVLTELQQEARIIMELITKNLRQAQNATIIIDRVSGQPHYSRIRFTTIQGTNVTYYQERKTLHQIIGSNSKILTNNLRYVAFTFPQSDDITLVSVALTLEKYVYELRYKALHMASEKVRIMN